jgi:V8-like Glu-specific endopeptidase
MNLRGSLLWCPVIGLALSSGCGLAGGGEAAEPTGSSAEALSYGAAVASSDSEAAFTVSLVPSTRDLVQDGKDLGLRTPDPGQGLIRALRTRVCPEARGPEPEAPGNPLGSGSAGLGHCTGVVVTPHAILTAGHCVDGADGETIVETLRVGPSADHCVGSARDPCRPTRFRIARHPTQDLALLIVDQPLHGVDVERIPNLVIRGAPKRFFGAGFGVGSVWASDGLQSSAPGKRLIRGEFALERSSAALLLARGSTTSGLVCKGDSGGPAFARLPDGHTGLLGLLLVSENGAEDEECTPSDGLQAWLRAGVAVDFIENHAGACARRTIDSYEVADCRNATPARESAVAAGRLGKAEEGGDAAWKEYLGEHLVKRWDRQRPDGQFEDAAPPTPGVEETVFVGTPVARYRAIVDRSKTIAGFGALFGETAKGAPSSAAGAWGQRSWSYGVDNRILLTSSNLELPVGQLITSFAGGSVTGYCSATLIGPRLVRTAAHCLIPDLGDGKPSYAQNITFYLRRNGSTQLATVGWSMYEWGGRYVPNGCYKSSVYKTNRDCWVQDWALIILPANWWSSLGYIPRYWGYRIPDGDDIGRQLRFVGYPTWGEYAPANLVYPRQYEDRSSSCSIASFYSEPTLFWSGCDTSSGQSGGPIFDPTKGHVLGHTIFEDVSGLLLAAPNFFVGMDDWLFSEQNRLRAAYP